MESLILYDSPFPKNRVGRPNDGGYVISILPGDYDLFISGGISNDISFEESFLALYPNLICYAFDGTIPALPKTNNKNIIFVKKNLGNKNTDTLTDLHEYMENSSDIFMKIDIEGHEFRVMPTIITSGLISKVKQLVIEIHSPADIQLYPKYFVGLDDVKNEDMFGLLNQINNTHTLIHFHGNNGCNLQMIDGISLPHVFELTFIRNDFVINKTQNTRPLPTELDMRNIWHKNDYTFNGFPYTI